ncbi:MAG: DUF4190 domain-containing protein [Phycisphaerales bacterium]|nr:MAG: hypothetical protein IPK69_08015 [Phycisphaerales bacterium]
MTQYTQNPYGSDVMEPQQRLSLAALFAMILGIVSLVACCIPVVNLGVAGVVVLLAIVGLVSISRSEGRLRGTGMAITGLVLGGLVLLIGGLWTVGAAQAGPKFFGPYGDVFVAAESGDVSLAKQVLTGEAGDKVDASMLGAFQSEYQAKVGHFVGVEMSSMGILKEWLGMGKYKSLLQTLPMEYQQNAIPMPVRFDNGKGILWMKLPQTPNGGGKYMAGPIVDAALLVEGGSEIIYLYRGRNSHPSHGTTPEKVTEPTPSETPSAPVPSEVPATP